jgi:hypothetical protein
MFTRTVRGPSAHRTVPFMDVLSPAIPRTGTVRAPYPYGILPDAAHFPSKRRWTSLGVWLTKEKSLGFSLSRARPTESSRPLAAGSV